MRVLQIIPRLPPAICGVGDHAIALGNQLADMHDCHVTYLAVNSSPIDSSLSGYDAISSRTSTALLAALRLANLPNGASILLHFSGYAYGTRGICFWLIRSLKRFLAERPDIHLITMFHELWTPAPVLSRSSWARPLQRSIVKRLALMSDIVQTNRAQYREQIMSVSPTFRGAIGVNNVFSNFGEPNEIPPICDRRQRVILFRPPEMNTIAGQIFWQGWRLLCERVGELPTVIIGRTQTYPESELIETRGFVAAEEASRLLVESQFSYFDYFDGYLGKSGIFAAIACHGVVPIMPSMNHSDAEGIYHGKHYLLPCDDKLFDPPSLEAISAELQLWYEPHNITATASDYVDAIGNLPSNGPVS